MCIDVHSNAQITTSKREKKISHVWPKKLMYTHFRSLKWPIKSFKLFCVVNLLPKLNIWVINACNKKTNKRTLFVIQLPCTKLVRTHKFGGWLHLYMQCFLYTCNICGSPFFLLCLQTEFLCSKFIMWASNAISIDVIQWLIALQNCMKIIEEKKNWNIIWLCDSWSPHIISIKINRHALTQSIVGDYIKWNLWCGAYYFRVLQITVILCTNH